MDSDYLVTQKIIKDGGFIIMIQDAFEHENLIDFKDNLQNTLNNKQDEIKKYCNDNYQLMIQNFIHYYSVRNQIMGVGEKMDTFQKKLERTRKSNQYDTKDINHRRTQVLNIINVQKNIIRIKNAIALALKSVQSAQSDKMTSSIRNVEKIKVHSILSTSNHLTGVQNILVQIAPLIYKRVQSEADTKITRWIQYSKQKQLEIGTQVLQQCELYLRTSVQGRMSMIGDRQSIFFDRPSILGPSSAPNRNSVLGGRIINSIFTNNNMEARDQNNGINNNNRMSSFKQLDRTSDVNRSSMKRISYNRINDNKDALIQDFKIDYSSLKQPQFIYETMKQKQLFLSQLKTQRQRLILESCETIQTLSIYDIHAYLSNVIGFFVIDKDMSKVFREYDQSNQLLIDSFKIVEKQIRLLFQRIPPEDLLQLKKELVQFGTAFGKMGIPSIQHSSQKMLCDQFVVFCRRRTQIIKQLLSKKIQQDGFQNVKTNIREDYDQYVRIFELTKTVESEDHQQVYQSNKYYDLPFSLIVQESVNQVNMFIENSIQYLNGLSDFDESVITNLDVLYQEICDVVKGFIAQSSKDKDPLQLCQLAVNIACLEISVKFFRKQIENYLQISSTKDFQAVNSFKEIKCLCEDSITTQLNLKVQQQLSQLALIQWEPLQPNKGPHDFFEMLVSYLESMFCTISFILPSFVESSIYLTFKFINQMIWTILVENVKTFNILGLVNLNQDILCLTKLCNTIFQRHVKLMDCLKEIREFLELFLAEHPDDYLDSKKRQQKYAHLSAPKILLVFPKYKKIKYGKYPIVRKRELKNIIKKIHDNPGSF